MKPKRTQKHTGSSCQGKTGDKKTVRSTTTTANVSLPAKLQPFAGKVFYLDLPSNRIAETLERDVKELGGTVEKFFSKEIKYLVSNKREAKYVQCLRQDSPIPSPGSGQSSPYPRSNRQLPGNGSDSIRSRTKSQNETSVTSRGKSLVEIAVKEKEKVRMNKILSNALEWGVKVLYVDDVIAYVEKKKKTLSSQCPVPMPVKTSVKTEPAAKRIFQKYKGGCITKPFVKVEDSSRHYRPIYLSMPNMPELSLKTASPCSPFSFEDKDQPGNRGAKASASDEKAHGRKKNKDKKRGGFCECCMIKYENLATHLQSECHKAFSRSEEYLVVDRLASTLHCSFAHFRGPSKRPKCSVSSAVFAPGPLGKTELQLKGDRNVSEVINEGQHLTVDIHEESASLINREGDKRDCFTFSDRNNHRSLARKQTHRQNSLTFCAQKAQQDEIPQQVKEMTPSKGECLEYIPPKVPQADPEGQVSHADRNCSTSHCCVIEVQDEFHAGSINVRTNQEGCEKNKEPRRRTDNNLSEREAESLPSIQRKIRAYKHKRRKVSTHVTCQLHHKQSDVCHDAILKLWELFHSSDDMDVEFRGFDE
ncbi:protein DBF4 homolog A [Aulostomus maculatus]